MNVLPILFAQAAVLVASLCASTVVNAAPQQAQRKLTAAKADVYVVINPRKDSGHPWHGPGDLFVLGGKMVTHFPEAPGAVLCLVTPDGNTSCPGQPETGGRQNVPAPQEPASTPRKPGLPSKIPGIKGQKYSSPCPSAYNCEFEDIALPKDDIFGLVIIDPAMMLTNLVDAIIVTRTMKTKKDEEVIAFDGTLRSAVNKLAPPGPFESKRRMRKFEVRTLNECEKGCKFSQSEITIETD